MGRDVRTFAAAASGLAALAALTGCDGMAHTQLDYTSTEQVAITEIRVSGGSGDVTVNGTGPAGEVRINRSIRYRGNEPGKTYRLSGGTLFIDTGCGNFCRVSYDIQAPPGVTIRGGNGSGDVSLTDIAGVDLRVGSGSVTVTDSTSDVTVHAGSGDITLTGVGGAVTAETGSGSIEARSVGEGPARVRTGSGDLAVTLVKPNDVRARAGSGDVTVAVPAGSYRVRADTGSGDETINVSNDPAGKYLIEVDSGSGDITLATN